MNKLSPLAWVGAAVAFVTYPALRPYTDETGLAGLAAMGSDRWLWAHVLGMLGFVLLIPATRSGAGAAWARWGAILVLPYYGGETFGLHAIGAYVTARQDPGLIEAVNGFRYQPVAITLFGLGLVLLAVAGVRLILSTRTADRLTRSAALLTGLGLALYLPQFFGGPALRVGHGVVLGLGCLLFAMAAVTATEATPRNRSELVGHPTSH